MMGGRAAEMSVFSTATSGAGKLLEENRQAMDELARSLIENEEVGGDVVYKLLAGSGDGQDKS